MPCARELFLGRLVEKLAQPSHCQRDKPRALHRTPPLRHAPGRVQNELKRRGELVSAMYLGPTNHANRAHAVGKDGKGLDEARDRGAPPGRASSVSGLVAGVPVRIRQRRQNVAEHGSPPRPLFHYPRSPSPAFGKGLEDLKSATTCSMVSIGPVGWSILRSPRIPQRPGSCLF